MRRVEVGVAVGIRDQDRALLGDQVADQGTAMRQTLAHHEQFTEAVGRGAHQVVALQEPQRRPLGPEQAGRLLGVPRQYVIQARAERQAFVDVEDRRELVGPLSRLLV